MRFYNKKTLMRPEHIKRLNRSLKSNVKMRGRGFLDKSVELVKNIDLNDPKVKIAIAMAPMVGNLLMSATKAGYNAVNNNFGHLVSDKFVGSLPGESNTHMFGMNFIGPGTNAPERLKRGIMPVNLSDASAMRHDLQYGVIQKKVLNNEISRSQGDQLVRASDKELRANFKNARNDPSATRYEKVINHISDKAIMGKNLLENVGVLSKGKFAGYGKKNKVVALKKLQKQAYEITGKGKAKKNNLNKVLAKVAAKMIRKRMKGGNAKQLFDSVGSAFNKFGSDTSNFFNNTIPAPFIQGYNDTNNFFTKTVPAPFIQGYNDTKKGLTTAYNATLGF